MSSALPFDLRSINRQTLFFNPDMADSLQKSRSSSPGKYQHLCILVHGLWGNTTHLNYVAQSLREKYDDQQLIVYSAKRNTGSLTYDGIEIGAERVAKEIEDILEELERDGHKITRFSIVGYSLGGLVARYTIGLLYHKGYFDRMTPVNFTTFVSPHLGVRTPLVGYPNRLWNVLGARTLSTSGRQLFMIDNFRETGHPLLSVLADPESIFIHALARFQHRSLYTNIINDKSAVYYTTGISKNDPFTNLDKLKLNYLKEFEPVVLDPDQPFEHAPAPDLPTVYQRIRTSGHTFLRRTPIFLALAVLIPVATVVFMINSGIQTFRSRRRIQLHEKDGEGLFGVYQFPLMVQDMRVGLEDAFENVNSAQRQDYLPEGSEEIAEAPPSPTISRASTAADVSVAEKSESELIRVISERSPEFPTLALTPAQFAIIKSLDDVGFRKYPVHIHKSSHSHAAIIVRYARRAFDEGKVVVRHWLEQDFKI
jgi:Putative serine esterase (DUF676)